MSEFSKRFKELRESRGFTQDKAAELLGISRSTIAGYESEDKSRIPREDTLTKIADLFNTTIDYLLGRTDDPNLVMSNQARVLVDSLSLSDEEIMKKITFNVDGIPLTEDQVKMFLGWVRMERAKGNQNK